MKNLTPDAAARLATYAAAALGGLVCIVIGATRGDLPLIGAGAGLLGVGGLAGANVPRTPA